MSQDKAAQIASDSATTVVVVVPSAQSTDPSGSIIAAALERAAHAFRATLRPSFLAAGDASEAALMRRVEAEVYGAG